MNKSKTIIVGGPIAAGKSSLVGSFPCKTIQELDPNDELQKILLEQMYHGDDIAKKIFQIDMMLSRFDKYKIAADSNEWHVFDRSIFEDYIFAKELFGKEESVWNYYNSIWEDKVREMTSQIGLPILYIYLDINWEIFQKRLALRNREAEIKNFDANKKYFFELHQNYKENLTSLLKKYSIEYIVIDTNNLSKLEVIDLVNKQLIDRDLLNES